MSFTRDTIRLLRQIGKPRTAERYTTVMNSFRRFLRENDVFLDEVDSNLMVRYETFLKARGICPNSISYYMRGLRAIYNRAVEKELTGQRSPFKHVYTGIDKTVKRAVPLKIIRQIRELDLTLFPAMDFARDIFLFSFYTRGMSFIDMAFLEKKIYRTAFCHTAGTKPISNYSSNGENPYKRLSISTTSQKPLICCQSSTTLELTSGGNTKMRPTWSMIN